MLSIFCIVSKVVRHIPEMEVYSWPQAAAVRQYTRRGVQGVTKVIKKNPILLMYGFFF